MKTKPILECVAGDRVANPDGSLAYTFRESPRPKNRRRNTCGEVLAEIEWSDGGIGTREWPIGATVPMHEPAPVPASRLANVRGFVESVRLHEFRDCVALSFTCNDGGQRDPVRNETVYLSAACVSTLRNVLRVFTAQPGGQFPTVRIDSAGRTSDGNG